MKERDEQNVAWRAKETENDIPKVFVHNPVIISEFVRLLLRLVFDRVL